MNARTGLREQRFRMTRIAADSDAVFDQAIDRGVLSEDPGDANFAGHYMYMFHDAGGGAWFKHRDTRVYVTMGPATCSAARGRRAAPCKGAARCKGAAGCNELGPCTGAHLGGGAAEREAGQP